MINSAFVFLLSMLILTGCNSGELKIHENHEELITFMKKGNIYNGEVFDEDFISEGEKGDRIVLIGRSVGYFKLAEVKKADEDLKIKILNYVSSNANLKQGDHNNKYGRQVASNLSIRSRYEDPKFNNTNIRKLKCIKYLEPQLDLTYTPKVDCRIFFSAPKSLFQNDNN